MFQPLKLDEFNLGARDELVNMAKHAETAERYEDMCIFMKQLVNTLDEDLTVEERNLLSVAYKNVIGARRASWRTLNVDENQGDDRINVYKKQIEKELQSISHEVLALLEDKLVKRSSANEEAAVFYLKMSGDYYRYLAEFIDTEGYDKKASENYERAMDVAKDLKPTHPIRLGLALNYSVCMYEILKDQKKACDLAKTAFDDAIAKLDELDEASYKDSTLIMQLLRDNLTLWTTEDDGDN